MVSPRRTIMEKNVVEPAAGLPGHTYAEPLAGLRVSWGSILAGAVAALAVSLILWSLALAIILTATHTSALRSTLVAMGISAIVTTLIGALVGGWLAGYLPGNPSRLIAAVHAFLAWGLAFLLASVVQLSMFTGVTRTTTQAAMTTTAQVAGSHMALDQNAYNLLKSLGYSDSEASQMVNQSKSEVQHMLRGRSAGTSTLGTSGDVDTAMNNVFHFMAGLTWAWFGTWVVSALLAIAGGLMGARRLALPPPGGITPPAEIPRVSTVPQTPEPA
jgi:hypothetical protein